MDLSLVLAGVSEALGHPPQSNLHEYAPHAVDADTPSFCSTVLQPLNALLTALRQPPTFRFVEAEVVGCL
jgi:hypothetical protein